VNPDTELSFVIPVFNGSLTVPRVVEQIHQAYADLAFEVVLVNDGSDDASEATCRELADRHPDTVTFVHLARNFGEHNAVLAGLHQTAGAYVAILDDDGQNPPGEVRRMLEELERGGYDVVYGAYRVKQHSRFRNLGSAFNDWIARIMLEKPADLYLSSFKVMSRFMVDEITRYRGAFPYIDGLILRASSNLGMIDVEHREREASTSTYTLRKLFALWLNMFLNFSIAPLRIAAVLGIVTAGVSLLLMAVIVFDRLFINPDVAIGVPTVLVTIVFFAGVQLAILGTIGEYLGRLFLDHSNAPQFVVRYVKSHRSGPARSD
jgi:undecaprenyl-phosphate 4-deoxy-4-formamido-L-arabinose transferase